MHQFLFAAPLLWALCDRLFGSDKPAFKGKKAVIAALSVGGGFLLGGVAGALLGLVWFVYRALPFKGGSGAPETSGERLAAVLRHAVVVPPVLLVAYWRGLSMLHVGAVFAIYAAVAATLAVAYGLRVIAAKKAGAGIGRENAIVEILRGLSYGIACALAAHF